MAFLVNVQRDGLQELAPALLKTDQKWRLAPLETFRSPGYRYLWSASFLWNQARWMDRVVIGWVVFDMTNSAWNLAVSKRCAGCRC